MRKPAGEAALEIRNLSGEKFRDVNLTVRAGEIVGVAGLVGAGRSETARAAFGIDRYTAGEVRVRGQALRRGSPMRAKRLGMCLLPEDRKVEGLALPLSIRENMVVSSLRALNPSGLVSAAREREQVGGYVESLEIATSSMDKLVQFLSGGTQQKVVIAKWLLSQSQVFIFDEPTRGIDVGAKQEIYELMNRKEFHLTGSWMSYSAPFPGREWELTAHYFATGELKFDPAFIFRTYPMSQVAEAFALYRDPAQVHGKIMLINE